MASPLAHTMLTLLVWAPAAGALLSALPGEARVSLRRSVALGFAAVSLALASFLALTFEPGATLRELRRWVPALGLSYDVLLDDFGSVVVLWISILAVLALASGDSRGHGRRAQSLILLAETALLGLATAADGVLLLVFYGIGLLSFALLLARGEEMKMFFVFQSAGMTLAAAFIAVSYHLTEVQTGFPSAEIGRFASLVSFPDFRDRMLLLGGGVVVFAGPLFPLTSWVQGSAGVLSTQGKLLLFGGWSLAGTLFFVRAVSPSYVTSEGAHGGMVLIALCLLSVLYGGIVSGRSWPALLVGFQGLVALGLLSPTASGVAAGHLGMLHLALALSAITLWKGGSEDSRGPALTGGIAALLFLSPAWVVLRDQWSHAPAVAALAGLGAILMAFRIARMLPPLSRWGKLRLLPLVVGIWALWFAEPWRFAPSDSAAPAIEQEE